MTRIEVNERNAWSTAGPHTGLRHFKENRL